MRVVTVVTIPCPIRTDGVPPPREPVRDRGIVGIKEEREPGIKEEGVGKTGLPMPEGPTIVRVRRTPLGTAQRQLSPLIPRTYDDKWGVQK